MSVYLAIDPGGTCGMALVNLPASTLLDPEHVQTYQMNDVECVDWCKYYIDHDWVIFMERFFITVQTAQLSPEGSHKTLDVIGTVKNLCRWKGASFRLQSKNDAAKFVTNEQLRNLDLWRASQDHARDAIRHLLYGIVFHSAGEACEDLKRRMA